MAPASSRFITSHDLYSASSLIIEMFFKAIGQFHPDLIIFSGVHLLEAQVIVLQLAFLTVIISLDERDSNGEVAADQALSGAN